MSRNKTMTTRISCIALKVVCIALRVVNGKVSRDKTYRSHMKHTIFKSDWFLAIQPTVKKLNLSR